MAETLTLRALNRATLARQMLLARVKISPLRVIERLVGMQAQVPRPPYVGIWSRTTGFAPQHLTRLIAGRKAVRATTLRGTLHLMTSKDFLGLRGAMQPALTHGAQAILKGRPKGVDLDALMAEARTYFKRGPCSFEALRDHFAERHPKGDLRAMAYFVRLHLPLVQVPADTKWGYAATSDFTLAESWLGKTPDRTSGPVDLARRYLAAFGPAGPSDLQTWSGLPAAIAREAFAKLRPELVALRDERGRELFDLAKAPRPAPETPAAVRYLPEFDNLVLSHADRRRFVADAHRRAVYLPALRVAATFLVDGFVAGTWKVERKKDAVMLALQPFGKLATDARDALVREGRDLARFLEDDATRFDVKISR